MSPTRTSWLLFDGWCAALPQAAAPDAPPGWLTGCWHVFADPQHDSPKFIDYRRTGDRLQVRLSAASPGPDGKRALFAFRLVACDPLSAAS